MTAMVGMTGVGTEEHYSVSFIMHGRYGTLTWKAKAEVKYGPSGKSPGTVKRAAPLAKFTALKKAKKGE